MAYAKNYDLFDLSLNMLVTLTTFMFVISPIFLIMRYIDYKSHRNIKISIWRDILY